MPADPPTPPVRGEPKINPAYAIGLLMMQAAMFTAAGAGLWHVSGRALSNFVSFSFVEIAIGAGFGAALICLAATLFHGFPAISDQLVRMQSETYRFLGPKLGWPAIVLISLAAGISEEAALRGGLQTWLGDHVGPAAAIGVCSAVFAALHLAKPVITALLLIIGVLFGVVFWLSGSLVAVMLAHVLYDIWALRYLNREMHRLGLFDDPVEPAAPLANPADAS